MIFAAEHKPADDYHDVGIVAANATVTAIPSGESISAITAVKTEATNRYVQNRRAYGMTAVVYR